MWGWNWGNGGSGGWASPYVWIGPLVMALFWIGVIVCVVFAIRYFVRQGRHGGDSALEILKRPCEG